MKILALDFDGVIHSYSSGWKGPRVIPDEPVPGALKFIVEAVKNNELQVMIYSSRSRYPFARRAMKKWLFKQYMELAAIDPDDRWRIPDYQKGEIPRWLFSWIARYAFADPWDDEARDAIKRLLREIKWPTRKPPAFLTIDDRAWTFRGTWPDLLSVLSFKPWNKQEV
ncbi:MAG: hypothetical protein ACYSTZ_09135 [Planctomycetota bacterium]|jgi:hypothetical protein